MASRQEEKGHAGETASRSLVSRHGSTSLALAQVLISSKLPLPARLQQLRQRIHETVGRGQPFQPHLGLGEAGVHHLERRPEPSSKARDRARRFSSARARVASSASYWSRAFSASRYCFSTSVPRSRRPYGRDSTAVLLRPGSGELEQAAPVEQLEAHADAGEPLRLDGREVGLTGLVEAVGEDLRPEGALLRSHRFPGEVALRGQPLECRVDVSAASRKRPRGSSSKDEQRREGSPRRRPRP